MTTRYLVTGGAGFIGTNVADHYLEQGHAVTIVDNFSRAGSRHNAAWLAARHGPRLRVVEADVRRADPRLTALVAEADVVFHLAAQVAVTSSVADPREDLEVNVLGTFNILEAARGSPAPPVVVYSSTNKVYGQMADLGIVERDGRHAYADLQGIAESRPLDFHSPYGCSKGAGDQYALDYARVYGLRTIVFRQSCIYGPHQFGLEDQGWVAWFAIRALQGLPVTIYGDGRQVRDVLYVDDLVAAYDAAIAAVDRTAGHVYNIGGGPAFTLSLLELLDMLQGRVGRPVARRFADWRPGDQRVFVSDIGKAQAHFGWTPRVPPGEGVGRLLDWLEARLTLIRQEVSA